MVIYAQVYHYQNHIYGMYNPIEIAEITSYNQWPWPYCINWSEMTYSVMSIPLNWMMIMMMMMMMMMLTPVDPCIIGKKNMDVFWGDQARDSTGSQEASFSIQQIYEDECDVAVDCAVRNVLERLGWHNRYNLDGTVGFV